MAPKLYQLCFEGRLDEVRAALRRGDNVNSRGHLFKCTALMYATKHTEVVKLLLEQPLLGLNGRNKTGETALHYAVLYGNPEALQLLLEDSRLNCVNPVSDSGDTPLMRAVKSGQNEILSLLLAHKGIDINRERDADGRTAISIAVAFKNTEGLRLMLADPRLKDALNVGDIHAITPLMSAVISSNKEEIVRLLLKHPCIDVNCRDEFGHTALNFAAYLGRTEEARLILTESGDKVDLNIRETITGKTALHCAVQKHNNVIVKLLLERSDLDLACRDCKGYGVLAYAACYDNYEAEAMLMEDKRFCAKCKVLCDFRQNSFERNIC